MVCPLGCRITCQRGAPNSLTANAFWAYEMGLSPQYTHLYQIGIWAAQGTPLIRPPPMMSLPLSHRQLLGLGWTLNMIEFLALCERWRAKEHASNRDMCVDYKIPTHKGPFTVMLTMCRVST